MAGRFLGGAVTSPTNPSTPPLTDCASEQLHLSGRIQARGVLVAADLRDRRITYASANTFELIGAEPDNLFDSLLIDVFADEERPRLEHAIELAGQGRRSHDLYSMRLAADVEHHVDVMLHRSSAQVVIEIERAHKNDPAVLLEVLNASRAIAEATSVAEIEAAVASAVRALTGYDRGMVYRFHRDQHGEVVAEDCRPGLVSYLGHHFPASDIPLQAREIYVRTASRYIPDVDEGDVDVIAAPRMVGTSLDLGLAGLRSVSPFHLEYMRNMNTAASVSFSMAEDGDLTRLVSCTAEKPRSISPTRRRSCELLVLLGKLHVSAAEQISRLSDAFEREAIRMRLRAAMYDGPAVAEKLAAAADDLMHLCQADGAAVYLDGQYRSVGYAPPEDTVRRLANEIRAAHTGDGPWTTEHLEQTGLGSAEAAGCLFVALGAPDDFMMWFRREWPHRLRWLGDPRAHAGGSISPRTSFDTWLETVKSTSAPWQHDDLRAAQLLRFEVGAAQLSRAQAELAHLGLYDALTGLPNRRHLISLMASMLAGATPDAPVAALFIDLNDFKDINDEYGHDAGDLVLRETARRITEATRTSDIVGRPEAGEVPAGRLGGDEFVLLLPGAGAAGAAVVADRIRQSLLEPVEIGPDLQFPISAAIGVTLAQEPEDPEHVLRRADAAMYEDKRGRSPGNR